MIVGIHPVPSPEVLASREPREGQHVQGFYLVTKGQECGIFFSWDESQDRVNEAYNEKRVKAVPQPGSIYWTMPVAPAPVVHSREGHSCPSNSSDEYWNAVEENEQEFGAEELSAYLGNINLQDW
ncbi:hypothetical protein PILCRDRAFT_11121 [Piloderma croceum F 1598]|uniref:Uncharacterized protein n=1 Tax=Piloderma croceum (strain F 1598) TaxID=765440 RepID=A0A0C3F0V0_PILCF|nr:hypothetical protein PILCRDRAFT_11121 [Piloderma croceum F 1598]